MSSELLASGVDNLKGHLAGAFNVLTGSSGDYTDLGIGRKFGGAAAAYSLRDVGAMNGPVVRVRRDSDNSEQDFSALAVPYIPDWCNRQIIKPLDVRELVSGSTNDGRTGDFIIAKAAYSLRSLGDRQATIANDAAPLNADTVVPASGKYVVQVRRNVDGTIKSFTADEVTDGTLVSFVNESFTSSLPLDVQGSAAAAYSLRNLSSTYSGAVVNVRRSSDDTTRDFTANEVTDGTLLAFTNEDSTQYMQFDGSDDDIDVNAALLPATDNFTLTIKFFIDGNPSSDEAIFGQGSSSTAGRSNVQIKTDGTAFTFINSIGSLTTSNSIVPQTINTIVLSRSGTTVSLQLNGGTAVTATSSSAIQQINSDIGHAYAGDRFEGVITSLTVGSTTWDGSVSNATSQGWTVNGSPTSAVLNDGHVTTWYDQSGNGNNATQGTPGSQPKIVSSGSLVTGGIVFDSGEFLEKGSLSISSPLNTFVVSTADTDHNGAILKLGTNTSQQYRTSTKLLLQYSETLFSDASTYTVGQQNLQSFQYVAGTSVGFFNGTQVISATATGETIDKFRLGNSSTGLDGKINEVILYNSDQSSERTAIESNINNHYSIF